MNNIPKYHPRPGSIYTGQEILKELHLKDSPCLMFRLGGVQHVVQEAHLTEDQFLSVPGFAESRWKYVRTTHEWIPVFTLDSDQDPKQWFDIEPGNDWSEGSSWVTPKGFPREQYVPQD